MSPITPIAREIAFQSVIQPAESTLAAASCDHMHESTSRYDRASKRLTFLLVCPVCRIEKVIETREYEPRFQAHAADQSAGATVHELPVRRSTPLPARQAA
jgi:hypothetical protein